MPRVGVGADVGTRHLALATYDGAVLRMRTIDLRLWQHGNGHVLVDLKDAHIPQHISAAMQENHDFLKHGTHAYVEQQMKADPGSGHDSSSTMLQVSQNIVGFLAGRYPGMHVSLMSPRSVRARANTSVGKDTGITDKKHSYKARKMLS